MVVLEAQGDSVLGMIWPWLPVHGEQTLPTIAAAPETHAENVVRQHAPH